MPSSPGCRRTRAASKEPGKGAVPQRPGISMPDIDTDTQEPLRVSILAQGGYLVASIHTALDDSQLVRFQRTLMEQIGMQRSRGVIIDVAALDVIDSFASHTLRNL